jgi:polyhydroxybutyrate depolymerase
LKALLGICLAGQLAGCLSPGATVASIPSATPSPTAAAACPAGSHVELISSGGQLRGYQIYVPFTLPLAAPAALVFGFHGAGGRAGQYESYSGLSALADRQGFIAVYPQALGSPATWNTATIDGNEDVQFVRDLIAALTARCHVDPARIYATGFSLGGGMANRLACDLAGHIAAIGSASGVYQGAESCAPSRPVPIIAFHGTADADVPYNGIGQLPRPAYYSVATPIPLWASNWATRNGCRDKPAVLYQKDNVTGQGWGGCRAGANVVLYSIEGGGHAWPAGAGDFSAAQLMWDFFVEHPLPSR